MTEHHQEYGSSEPGDEVVVDQRRFAELIQDGPYTLFLVGPGPLDVQPVKVLGDYDQERDEVWEHLTAALQVHGQSTLGDLG